MPVTVAQTAINKEYVDTKASEGYSVSRSKTRGGAIGYQGRDIGEEYVITIVDYRPLLENEKQPTGVTTKEAAPDPIIIRALLQEQIGFSTTADWSSLSAASVVSNIWREFLGLVERSPVNRWVSRRIWRGTTPIAFNLNLRFEAETNSELEVLAPCKELQRMVLPFVGSRKSAGEYFLSPPGPSVLGFSLLGDAADIGKGSGRGEVIDVKIGKLLYIRRCVVSKVSVNYFPRFQEGGNPTGASVNIEFQTYEIVTKESLDTEVYNPLGARNLDIYEAVTPATKEITEGPVQGYVPGGSYGGP